MSCRNIPSVTRVGDVNVCTVLQYSGWVAFDDDSYDGPGSPIGTGKTEAEAIEDLQEQLAEKEERLASRVQRG